MSKELKNKVDSIRRTIKNKGIEVTSAQIENRILELCPDYPDDWCPDIRSEVIKSLVNELQPTELATVNPGNSNASDLRKDDTELVSDATLEVHPNAHSEEPETITQQTTQNYVHHTLALQEKSELVASTAYNMGIVLDIQEVENIAENINYSAESLDEAIDDIQSAITQFIEHKAASNTHKIASMVSEVTEYAEAKFNENSQQLTDGLRTINKRIIQQNTDFKSSIRTALKAFAIPLIKAE
ncbi:MAG: hypothetical protein KME59_20530 [Trichormus sp. ATA11-4-KO1]|jgi:uncharacterized protein YukE/gas vesicle protein|nr:hypothetical protein [Trichormus sp. ATA11-4-KO1]